jgi:hypothetical protein
MSDGSQTYLSYEGALTPATPAEIARLMEYFVPAESEAAPALLIPLSVSGYTAQPQYNIDLVNRLKRAEETVLRIMDEMKAMPEIDKRELAVGITHLQTAFMWTNRSVFRPKRLEGEI